MTSTRRALTAPFAAILGVCTVTFFVVWAGTVALSGIAVSPAYVAVLFGGQLAILGVGVGGVVVSSTGRLEELERAVRDLENGSRSTDFPTDRDDEVGTIAGSMETVVTRLDDAERRAATQGRRANQRAAELSTLSEALSAHAEAFDAAMERAAAGDLTARIDSAAEDERFASLAREFDAMLGDIEETTDRLKRFANDVATHGEEVTASAEEVQHASEQVSISVQEISETTETQSRTFDRVADRIDDLAATTQAISGRAESVSQIAKRTAESGDRGRESARDAAMAMESIDTSSASATEEMAELERLVDEIDEVAEFITEIAEEVNVLALNANIEASRSAAGDSEGFAVVAKEVKDLAAETKFSAQRIENLVGEVKVQTELSAAEVQSTREAVTEGRDTVSEAIDALEEIAGYAEDTHRGVLEITEATDQQAATTDDVVAMVDHAAELSREVDAEAGTVAAAAEQQTSALTEVSSGTEQLSTEAQSLRDALDRFRTDVEPDDVTGGWLPASPSPPQSSATSKRSAAASEQSSAVSQQSPAASQQSPTGPQRAAATTQRPSSAPPRSPPETDDVIEDTVGSNGDAANAPSTNGTGTDDAWPGDWSSTATCVARSDEE